MASNQKQTAAKSSGKSAADAAVTHAAKKLVQTTRMASSGKQKKPELELDGVTYEVVIPAFILGREKYTAQDVYASRDLFLKLVKIQSSVIKKKQ